ncbi:MAG: M14 family zinc carboxypeptidase, partial [Imperialibacter sp.]
MKRIFLLLSAFVFTGLAQAQNEYFFPEHGNFDSSIPSPEEFLGYPIGEWHTRHDNIVAYMEKLAAVSDRATVQNIGYTYEHRAQVVLTISSPANLGRLEAIRTEHLKLTDPAQPMPDISKIPAIIHLGYNVHGNEPSSAEAALLTAYYLVASNEPDAEHYRQNGVIFIEPSLNPDGRDRHANWANMHKGFPPVADPIDREHNEVWPGGRTNHYWYDLNRDWLPLAHVESQNRIKWHQKWYPNMVTDFHEMGTNSTY